MTERNLAKRCTMAIMASVVFMSAVVCGDSTVETYNQLERRSHRDHYTTNNTSILCHEDNELTYLVFEGQCVNNENLTIGCSFEVTPSEELLTLFLSHPKNDTITYETAQTLNSSSSPILVDALIRSKESDQAVNNSLCVISSLEVYRGSQQAFVIDKSVFMLSDSGAIKITTTRIEPYEGELYRMNLSCSDNHLPPNGCLFFKVQGITNLNKAKFNCTVPGMNETLMACINEMNSRVTDGNAGGSTLNPSASGESSGPSDVTLDIITYTILVAAVCLSLLFVVALTMTVLYSKFSQQSETEQTEQK